MRLGSVLEGSVRQGTALRKQIGSLPADAGCPGAAALDKQGIWGCAPPGKADRSTGMRLERLRGPSLCTSFTMRCFYKPHRLRDRKTGYAKIGYVEEAQTRIL